MKFRLVLPFALVLFLVAFALAIRAYEKPFDEVRAQIRMEYADVQQVQTITLQQWMTSGTDNPLVLDVRTAPEFAVSHLPHAIHTPTTEQALAAIGNATSDQPVVVYCSIGARSSEFARELAKHTNHNVYNLDGSIFAWANQGQTVVRNGEPVAAVHPYNWWWGRHLRPSLRTRSVE